MSNRILVIWPRSVLGLRAEKRGTVLTCSTSLQIQMLRGWVARECDGEREREASSLWGLRLFSTVVRSRGEVVVRGRKKIESHTPVEKRLQSLLHLTGWWWSMACKVASCWVMAGVNELAPARTNREGIIDAHGFGLPVSAA